MQTGVKEEKETYSSQVSSQAYRYVDQLADPFDGSWSYFPKETTLIALGRIPRKGFRYQIQPCHISISVKSIGGMKRQQQNVKKIMSLMKTTKVFSKQANRAV